MFPKKLLVAILVLTGLSSWSQITTEPEFPTAAKKVVISFDSSKESRLGFFTGDLYAHTGVILEGNTSWQHVIESWGNNTTQPKLTNKGNGIYQIEISPDIKTFYSIKQGEKVKKLAFVFRSSDGKTQTNDLFVNVYEDGLVVEITSPLDQSMPLKNQLVQISATASVSSVLKLKVNNTVIAENTRTQLSANYVFSETGFVKIIAEATAGNETKTDTIEVFVRSEVPVQVKPVSHKKGINYPSENTAALVLWAPLKEYVFVLGDFNDWKPNANFQMKKDGDYFWLEIPGLEKGKEYRFQYFIDGKIKIADPYSEKISDPWNDSFISEAVYPGLITYPVGKTQGICSVLQPGQVKYNWEVSNFQTPLKEKMVIYELLVRDFTDAHTFKAVREKLDYLKDLRVNVLELMPVNEFEGNSSWGYNPSFYFAPDKYYGPKNELKKLIDECHKRGIAVVVDMVLNHSYSQSPLVQMYNDNGTVTAENPWYNAKSNFLNPSAQWGYDFNHESAATRELTDSVNAFWMSEYKVDGFRFDFTKGFSNTPYPANSWGSDFDESRIAILKRMTDEIRKRKQDAIIIFEHLADNSEEKVLADYGILLWGNMHFAYTEAARGNTAQSDLSGGVYSSRNWAQPNLVTYAESHDEERIMYTLKQTGLAEGTYNIKNQNTALDRVELNAVFHLLLPGPKMIWQFGERGYDVSINDFGGRLSEKPPHWQYLFNPDRTDLFKVMAKLSDLKQTEAVFSAGTINHSLSGSTKWYSFSSAENKVMVVGNFGTAAISADITFPATGKYYGFFTGDSISISSTQQKLQLNPGEYRLYSTKKMKQAGVVTNVENPEINHKTIRVYPNPASEKLTISSAEIITEVELYSVTGKKVLTSGKQEKQNVELQLEGIKEGLYIVKAIQKNQTFTQKVLVK